MLIIPRPIAENTSLIKNESWILLSYESIIYRVAEK